MCGVENEENEGYLFDGEERFWETDDGKWAVTDEYVESLTLYLHSVCSVDVDGTLWTLWSGLFLLLLFGYVVDINKHQVAKAEDVEVENLTL